MPTARSREQVLLPLWQVAHTRAPNDFTGQTELDEWSAIAKANVADSVSSSWAVCENDITAGYAQAENTIFRQMAAQGQSVFGAEGDTGAFSCLRSDGGTNVNLLDPPAQPWVTSVGGTSFENFNPGTNPHPNRAGNINRALYREYQIAPSLFFHDVTGAGHIAKNNGLFPAVPGFDLATGIGTIKMAPFIIGSF